MPQADLQTIVQRMIDAGESEDSIADVIREYPKAQQESGSAVTPYVAGGLATAKMAPAIVHGVNKVAQGAEALTRSSAGKYAPGVVAMDAAGRVARGDYKGAAAEGATAAAMSQVPRALSAVQRATHPAVQRMVRFAGELLPVEKIAGGPLMRAAGVASQTAGVVAGPALAMSTAYDTQQALMAKANDPNTSPEEREALMRIINRSSGGSRSR